MRYGFLSLALFLVVAESSWAADSVDSFSASATEVPRGGFFSDYPKPASVARGGAASAANRRAAAPEVQRTFFFSQRISFQRTGGGYRQGWRVGHRWGQRHRAWGWMKRRFLFLLPYMRRGMDFERGIRDGYWRGYDQSGLTTVVPVSTDSEVEAEFLREAAENEELQSVLERMRTVKHNDRCAEGVLEMLSALAGEDVRQYVDWRGLTYTEEGYPRITTQHLSDLFSNSDLFNQVDPNSPSKAFRVNVIEYPTLGSGHIEIQGPDGKWYSDGLHPEGSSLNSSIPKYVTSYDVDIEKLMGYETRNPQASYSYVPPFSTFFATDPNAAARNSLFG